VSRQRKFPAHRENTGNSVEIGSIARASRQHSQVVGGEIPYEWNREFLGSNSESLIRQQRTTLASRKTLGSKGDERLLVRLHNITNGLKRIEDWLRGLLAPSTEHGSNTSKKTENGSKSGARNQRCLHLDHAIL
jgi:hypothetical protein